MGLLDADVYGPSIPIMMNLRGARPGVTDDKKMIPLGILFNIIYIIIINLQCN